MELHPLVGVRLNGESDLSARIVLDEVVTLKWGRSNVPIYTAKGYVYTGLGDEFSVKTSDLNPGAQVQVRVECPWCHEIRSVKWNDVVRTGHTGCRSCMSTRTNLRDLTGQTFGRWMVLGRSEYKDDTTSVFWRVRCECGNEKNVRAQTLIKGESVSCGCYLKDNISSWVPRGANHALWGKFGALNPNWNPNITDDERLVRRSHHKNREWRNAIFERDEYTCQSCKKVGGVLNAHHLNGYADFPGERFELSNGVCLCAQCHHEFHVWAGWGRKGRVTREEYIRWLSEYNV